MITSHKPRILIEDLPALETLSEEEKALLFGAGRARLGLEGLESRELMAAGITAVLTGGTVRIQGTESADRIVIQRDGANLKVQGVTITNQAGTPVTPALTAVNAIRVDGLGGNDLVWIQNDLAEAFNIHGGTGADLIVAGPHSQVTTERDAADVRLSSTLVPVWKQLEAVTPNASGQYSLSSIKVGGFTLTGVIATVSASGVHLSGDLTLAALGKVHLTGTVTPDNTFKAAFPDRTLLGGTVAVKNATVTISGDRATVDATLTVARIGLSTRLTGWVKSDGTSLLQATASFTVAGFQVTGGKWTLRDRLEVNFTLPIAALGNTNVTFTGSYGATGWSISGTVPVTIQVGVVTLKQITVGVSRDQSGDILTLGAKGNIASIDGFVDATATARLYTDGRINLRVKADALKLGSYTVGNVQVTVANDTSAGRGTYVATLTGNVQVPGVTDLITLTGELRSNGYYHLKGEQTVQVAGLTLSQARFDLEKGGPLTFGATWLYSGLTITVSGTAEANGHVQFHSTVSTVTLPNGFKLLNFSATVDLNRPMNRYTAHLEGRADVLIGTVTFVSDTSRGAAGWPATQFSGTARIGGALAQLFTGTATFTVDATQVSFRGQFNLKQLPAVGLGTVSGSVRSDGTLTVGTIRVSTSDLTNRLMTPIARVLSAAGSGLHHIAYTVASVARSFTLTDLVKTLQSVGGNLRTIADALWYDDLDPFFNDGKGFDLHGLARALCNGVSRLTMTDLVGALHSAGASWSRVAGALWYDDIDKVFGGFDVGDLGYALSKAGLGTDFHAIALAVGKVGGMYLGDLARAVWAVPESNLADVVRALWHNDIDHLFDGGFGIPQLIGALKAVTGNLTTIAHALVDGGAMSSLSSALAAVGLGGGGGGGGGLIGTLKDKLDVSNWHM